MMHPVENTNTLVYLHGLCALRPRVTALRLRALLEAGAAPQSAWDAGTDLLRRAGWTPEAVSVFLEHRQRWDPAAEYARLEAAGIRLVPTNAPEFPPLLNRIYDPPLALYVRGTLPGDAPALAVVGSRKATPYGRSATHALVRPLSARGLVIVSGLAFGIDAEAHRAALETHGKTIAVLGTGVDDAALYPRAHRQLAHDIVASGGAVVSEFPPGTTARAEYFPQRNRVIAGLARATVVVEATNHSGALITARLALAENREVLVVPGPITVPTSEGTNRLLREGAAPALSADDILDALSLQSLFSSAAQRASDVDESRTGAAKRDAPSGLSDRAAMVPARAEHGRESEVAFPEPASVGPARKARDALELHPVTATASEHTVLSSLSADPKTIDDLLSVCTLPPHEVAATLSLLELSGRVRDVGGKHYVRC